MENPTTIADLERLETEIEEALINLIDKPDNTAMIADLQRRKSHLIEEIGRLRVRLCGNGNVSNLH